jgi:hypothetical protein
MTLLYMLQPLSKCYEQVRLSYYHHRFHHSDEAFSISLPFFPAFRGTYRMSPFVCPTSLSLPFTPFLIHRDAYAVMRCQSVCLALFQRSKVRTHSERIFQPPDFLELAHGLSRRASTIGRLGITMEWTTVSTGGRL